MHNLNMKLFVKKCVECGHELSEIGVFNHSIYNTKIYRFPCENSACQRMFCVKWVKKDLGRYKDPSFYWC